MVGAASDMPRPPGAPPPSPPAPTPPHSPPSSALLTSLSHALVDALRFRKSHASRCRNRPDQVIQLSAIGMRSVFGALAAGLAATASAQAICYAANGMDLIFVLDESGSVGHTDYAKAKECVFSPRRARAFLRPREPRHHYHPCCHRAARDRAALYAHPPTHLAALHRAPRRFVKDVSHRFKVGTGASDTRVRRAPPPRPPSAISRARART